RRDIRDSRHLGETVAYRILSPAEPRGNRRRDRTSAGGRYAEPVLPLEGLGQRGDDVVELGPMAERRLERRQGGQRVTRGGKELPEAWRVDAEQDRAVLEEAPAAPPLGAADDLAPVDFNLVA